MCKQFVKTKIVDGSVNKLNAKSRNKYKYFYNTYCTNLM